MPATVELVTVELPSAPMVHTPGLLKWAQNGYKFKKDRKAMVRVFTEGYDLTEQCAHDILSGKTPVRIAGQSVFFDYEAGKYRN